MNYQTHIVETEQDWKEFLKLPDRIYGQDPNWIKPVNPDVRRVLDKRNPYFKNGGVAEFLTKKNGQTVARAAVSCNSWQRTGDGEKIAFFGFFECVDDQEACRSLFDSVGTYARHTWDAVILEGPFNPTHYSEVGVLCRNYSEPVFFETYNPPYYGRLLENEGFDISSTLHTRVLEDTADLEFPDLNGFEENAARAGFRARSFRLSRFNAELEALRSVYNDAFSENWHYVPVSHEEYRYAARYMFLVTKPSLVRIIEYRGEPVGVLQFVFNFNKVIRRLDGHLTPMTLIPALFFRSRIEEVVLYAVGVKKKYRNGMAYQLLVNEYYKIARKFRKIYTTWISPSNAVAQHTADHVGLKPYKWFHMYAKQL